MDKETKELLETLCKGLPGVKIKASSFKKDVIFTVTGISSVNEDSNLFAVHCKDGDCEYVLPSNLCEVVSDESLFLELKESDCERIRKDVIWCIKHSSIKSDSRINYHVTTTVREAIAWLERQGEQKSTMLKPIKGNYYTCIQDYVFCEHDDATFKQGEIYKSEEDEKITADDGCKWPFTDAKKFFRLATTDEVLCQKLRDKTEPKFKVGDWICNSACIAHIASIEDGIYYFDEGDGLNITFVDEVYHLWDVSKDAKDGDVLASKNGKIIFLYNGRIDLRDRPCAYWGIHKASEKSILFTKCAIGNYFCEHAFPATKEQRDTLMKAITDAGYVWDADKKELRKIGEKPTLSENDETYLDHIITAVKLYYTDDKGKENPWRNELLRWIESLKERLGGEK